MKEDEEERSRVKKEEVRRGGRGGRGSDKVEKEKVKNKNGK